MSARTWKWHPETGWTITDHDFGTGGNVPVFGLQTLEGSIPPVAETVAALARQAEASFEISQELAHLQRVLQKWMTYAKDSKNPQMTGDWHDGYRQGWVAAYTLLEGMLADKT